jgi:hypothetical protein
VSARILDGARWCVYRALNDFQIATGARRPPANAIGGAETEPRLKGGSTQ